MADIVTSAMTLTEVFEGFLQMGLKAIPIHAKETPPFVLMHFQKDGAQVNNRHHAGGLSLVTRV